MGDLFDTGWQERGEGFSWRRWVNPHGVTITEMKDLETGSSVAVSGDGSEDLELILWDQSQTLKQMRKVGLRFPWHRRKKLDGGVVSEMEDLDTCSCVSECGDGSEDLKSVLKRFEGELKTIGGADA